MRLAIALVVTAVLCALGALILGEYEFSGATPIGAGILFGLVVSEIVVEIGRTRHPVVGLVTAALVAGSLGWASWVSSGEGLRPFPTGGWVAMAIGAVVAGWRSGGWRRSPAVADDVRSPD